jgi:transcriptional regulator GlxA family with amidase domain
MATTTTTFHIGVLIVPPIQFLDISPIDLFAMLSQSYFTAALQPAHLIALALPDASLKITYISPTGANTTSPTTARLGLRIDAGIDDPRVAPGELDVLLIPGPPPNTEFEESVLEFVRGHVGRGVDLLTVCSGVFVAASAGVLDGRKAAAVRGVAGLLKERFPGVEWVDKRFVSDGGRVWTSGMLYFSLAFFY